MAAAGEATSVICCDANGLPLVATGDADASVAGMYTALVQVRRVPLDYWQSSPTRVCTTYSLTSHNIVRSTRELTPPPPSPSSAPSAHRSSRQPHKTTARVPRSSSKRTHGRHHSRDPRTHDPHPQPWPGTHSTPAILPTSTYAHLCIRSIMVKEYDNMTVAVFHS